MSASDQSEISQEVRDGTGHLAANVQRQGVEKCGYPNKARFLLGRMKTRE